MSVEEFNLLADIRRKGGKIYSYEIPPSAQALIDDLVNKGYLVRKEKIIVKPTPFGGKVRVRLTYYVLSQKAKKLF